MRKFKLNGKLYTFDEDSKEKEAAFIAKHEGKYEEIFDEVEKPEVVAEKDVLATTGDMASSSETPFSDTNVNRVIRIQDKNSKNYNEYSYEQIEEEYGDVDKYVKAFRGRAKILNQGLELEGVVVEGDKLPGTSIKEAISIDSNFYGAENGSSAADNLTPLLEGTGVVFNRFSLEGEYGQTIDQNYGNLSYENPETGDVIKSPTLNLNTTDSKEIKNNNKIIEEFLNKNTPKEETTINFNEAVKVKTQEYREQVRISDEERNSILTKFSIDNNPDLFNPYEKTVVSGGYMGTSGFSVGQKISKQTVYPYSKEIEQAKIQITKQAQKYNETIPTGEEMIIKAQNVVREDLIFKAKGEAEWNKTQELISKNPELKEQIYTTSLLSTNLKSNELVKVQEKIQLNQNAAKKSFEVKDVLEQIITGEDKSFTSPDQIRDYVSASGLAISANSFMQEVQIGSDFTGNPITTKVPSWLLQAYKDVNSEIDSSLNVMKSQYDEAAIIGSELTSDKNVLSAADKNYSQWDKNMTTIGLGASDIVAGLTTLAANAVVYPLEGAIEAVASGVGNEDFNLGLIDDLASGAVDYNLWSNNIRDEYVDSVDFDEAFSSVSNFGKFMMQEGATQIPILATIMASGGAGSFVIGASTAGQKMMDMQTEIATGQADHPAWKLWLSSIGYGVVEGGFAALTTVPALKRAKDKLSRVQGNVLEIDNSLRAFAKSEAPYLIYDPILEASGEVPTAIFQNMIDGRNPSAGIDHAGFSGLAMGFTFAAIPFMKGAYNSSFSDYNKNRRLIELKAEADGFNLKLKRARTDKTKSILIEKIQLNADKQALEIDIISQNINENLRASAAERVIGMTDKLQDLRAKAKAIQSDSKLTTLQKQESIASLEAEYEFIDRVKQSALSESNMALYRPEFIALEGGSFEDQSRYNRLMSEGLVKASENKGALDKPNKKDISRAAYEIFLKEEILENNSLASNVEGVEFNQYETIEEAVKAIEADTSLTDEAKKVAIANVRQGADGWAAGDNKANVVVDNQLANQTKMIGTHEVGHVVFWELLNKNKGKFKGISDQLLKTVKQSDNAFYNNWIKKIEKDKKTGEFKPEEVISRFLELAGDKNFKLNKKKKGILGFFGAMVQIEFKDTFDFDFKGESDIVQFVTTIGAKIADGTLTSEDVQLAKESKALEGLTESSAESVDDKSFSLAPEDSVRVNEIWQKEGVAGYEDILNLLKPTAVSLAKRFKNRPNYDQQLVTDAIMTGKRGMLDVIMDYNKKVEKGESVPPLSGFINKSFSTKTGFKRYIDAVEDSKVLGEEFTDDVTEARGVAEEEVFNDDSDVDLSKKINATKFGPVKDKVEAISNIVNIEKGAKKTYKELTNEFLDVVSKEVFDISGKRISGKVTLTSPEAKKLQRLFVDADNVKKLIKTMPPYNVASSDTTIDEQGENIDVSRDVKGRAIGLSPKFIDKYYIPVTRAISGISNAKGRSLGKTSQPPVKELKPEYKGIISNKTIKQIQNDVGVTEAGIPNVEIKEADRSRYGTTLTGFARTYLANAINTVGRSKIDSKQGKADLGAGKSKLMFSNKEISDAENVFQSDLSKGRYDYASETDKKWPALFKSLGIENLDLNKKVVREKFLDDLISTGLAAKLPKSFWRNFQGTSKPMIVSKDGKNYVTNKKTNELIEVTSVKGKWKPANGIKLPSLIRDNSNHVFFTDVGEANIWINNAEQNGVKFAPESQMFKDLLYKEPYVKKVNKKDVLLLNKERFNDVNFINRQENKLKALESIFKTFEKFIAEGDDKSNAAIIGGLLKSTAGWQGHFIRKSAPVKFFQTGKMFDANGKKLFTEEHTLPATGIAQYLFIQAASGNVSKSFPNVRRNFFQGALLNVNDNKLAGIGVDGNKFSYKEATPEGWTLEDNIWARYFNANVAKQGFGIDPNSLMTYQGKTIYDVYQVDSAGNFIDAEFNENLAKPAKPNNKKLPAKLRLSSAELFNNNVLNTMQETDNVSQTEEISFSKALDLDKDFNDIIENKTGIASNKTYARVKAEVAGASKGKFNFFIPPSAEDFVGLLYSTLGKGSIGDAQMAWYKAHLLNPFARAMENLANDRANMMQDFRGLKKALKIVPKNLRKKIKDSNFTKEQAVRAYIWDKQGMEIPGLSQKDQQALVEFIETDENLKSFAGELIAINKGDAYAAPDAGWVAGTIDTDFIKALNTTKRSKYLEVWQQNVDQIFSEANLNKLEAAYGANYREAMVDMLKRMETGRNTSSGSDRLAARFTDWLTNSVGAIMFFNTRSAVLQTISAVNFINFSDNNVLKAGAAFANQPQYWSDFKKLFNSPFLLDRRSGLKLNVNEADIAAMAKGPGNSARNVIAGILKAGFLPTQLADSFAIASGGASFYRNRIKALQKEGLTEAEAEEQAFRDFREIAEESQQSSRPDKISQQQAGPLGRVVLAFANTPAQYARLIKKAASDLKNGRGDAKTNISKIIYYGVAQNLLFSALQQALFAIAFDDDEEEEKKNEKYFNIVNGMSDSILRGIGIGGAIVSVVKNTAIRLAKEADKKGPKYQDAVVKGVLQISPPISSKVGKLQSAGRSFSWNQEEMRTRGWSIDNPAYLASANVISAATNVPLDRAVKKVTNIVDAGNEDIEYYKRIALVLGWSAWELGIDKKGGKVTPPKTDMDKLYDLTKKQQIDSLTNLGISRKQIKALKLEEDRVNAILNPKSIKQIKVSKKDSLFGLNKKDQVKALEKLGLTKKEIRALRLESDRVEAIINQQKEKVE